VNSSNNKKQVLVLWREVILIGLAVVLIAAADNQQSVSRPLSTALQPANLSPETTIKDPGIVKVHGTAANSMTVSVLR